MMIINTYEYVSLSSSKTTVDKKISLHEKIFLTFFSHFSNNLIFFFLLSSCLIAGFLKLIFFISIIFVILLIIIASIIYIWVIRRFSTNLEQINRRLPEVNHNLLNHSIQDFEALVSVYTSYAYLNAFFLISLLFLSLM